MTYSAATPILGNGSVSAEAVQAYFVHRGPGYAPAYAPDKAYKAPPAGLGRAIVDECRRYPQAIVNHDIVAAQVMVETAAWQSKYARERNNPGGIGAINSNPDLAITFPTVAAGVRAHVAHLLVYALGDGPWTADDPRRDAVAKEKWLGTAPTWGGLNGKWAFPGTTYGQSITNLANALRDFANNGTWGTEPTMQPPSGWKPPEIIRSIIEWDASNRPHQRLNGGSWDYITTHNVGNTAPTANAAMHATWMHNLGKAGAKEPSWHYTVDEKVIYQHMEDDWAGYHASDNDGPGNFDSLGIELVEIGSLTLVIWNAAWLVAKKMKERGKTDIAATVKQHNHFARDGKNCPRLLRANNGARWNEYLAAIAYFMNENAQPEPAPGDDKLILPGQADREADGFPKDAGLERGFKGTLLAMGAAKYAPDPERAIVSIVGHVKDREEWTGTDGCVYQRCERVTLQYNPTLAAPWDIVFLLPHTKLPERKAA